MSLSFFSRNIEKRTAIIFLLVLSLAPVMASADITIVNPLKYSTLQDLVNAIIDFIYTISLALVPIMIIIGAYYFVTAGGDAKQIQTGKDIVFWTCVGFVVILLAKGLIKLLQDIVGI